MNNEEKILSMLENMQTDISGLKQDVSGLKQDVELLRGEVEQNKNFLLRMEYDHGQKLAMLLDEHTADFRKIDDHDVRIVNLEDTVETHTFEIDYLKGIA